MPVSLTIPNLGSHGLSTKDAIISILGLRWPLAVKQIHRIAVQEYAVSASYQAVHKMLVQLVEEGLILKNESGYSLNPDWIKKIKSFGDRLDKVYSTGRSFSDFQNKDIVNLYFENFIDMARFIIHTFHGEFPNFGNTPKVAMMWHAWMPIGANEDDYTQLKKIFEIPYYGLYRGNTPLDIFANQMLVKLGKKSLQKVDYPADGDILVQGDYVAQVFYSTDFKKKIDHIFKKTKSVENFNMVEIFGVYAEKNPVKVVISRNPSLAESLREEGIKLYEKNKAKKALV